MFEWANEESREFLSRGYLLPGETVEQRCRDIADKVAEYTGTPDVGELIYEYLGRGFYSLASPIWANFGRKRGLPISCNNSYIGDSVESIVEKAAEIAIMTKHGAGTSAYLGDIRGRGTSISAGGFADGVRLPATMVESTIDNISQGNVRRGNAAIYYPIDGPDIEEFLNFREEGSPIQKTSLGVCVSDKWMKSMIAGDSEKRKLWMRIIKKRFESGYPYIVFSDTMNRGAPDAYKDKGRTINGSNLCSEVALSSTEDESFVCCLMSMNLVTYDEWKDTPAVIHAIYLLDAVMDEYIDKTYCMKFMEAPRKFAIQQRALGLGTLGYHSYLQSKMIPFESFEAKRLNVEMHQEIATQAVSASQMLATKFGEPPMLKGYGRRNMTLMSIAPTTSSSFILGQVSPSIEPLASNYYTKDLAKGKFTYRNPYLQKVLAEKGMDTQETWISILEHGGSVQHLAGLTDHEKAVFKTFAEITPLEIIQQAAARQKHIDQSQSLNLMIHPEAPLKDVNSLMIEAWRLGIKSLYYQRGVNLAQEATRNILHCSACEA